MGDTSLGTLQDFLTRALRAGASARGDDASRARALVASGDGRLDPTARLEIYREQYWLRHLANLSDDFPTLAWAVGAAAFQEIATTYLEEHPPRTWDLQKLGAKLPGFVSGRAPWETDALALDAARLDWTFMEVFDAAEAGPLNLQALVSAPEEAWPSAKVEIHPAVRTLVLGHPLHDVRAALKSSEPVVERPGPMTTHLVVWRDPQCVLRAMAIEPMAFDLLDELAHGAPLGPACEAVARAHAAASGADLDAKVGAWFQQWTAAGWVSGVRLSLRGL